MDLILWRHAQAESAHARLANIDRPLTPAGQQQALTAAQWLNTRLPAGCRILVSPAVRTRQTAKALQRCYEVNSALAPDAIASEILAAAGWPDAHGTILIIGHQPTLGEIAASLLQENALWHPTTGSLCWLQTTDNNLIEAGHAPAILKSVFTP